MLNKRSHAVVLEQQPKKDHPKNGHKALDLRGKIRSYRIRLNIKFDESISSTRATLQRPKILIVATQLIIIKDRSIIPNTRYKTDF
jgi:hypothetical protein